MKHFAEARRDSLAAVAMIANCDGFCLIWDLRGELRLLVRTTSGANASLVVAQTSAVLNSAAEQFWSGTTWVWNPDVRLTEAERLVYEEAWRLSRTVSAGRPEIRELDRHLSKQT